MNGSELQSTPETPSLDLVLLYALSTYLPVCLYN